MVRELQELLTAEDFAMWVAWYRLEDEERQDRAQLEHLAARATVALASSTAALVGPGPAQAVPRALQEDEARQELTRRILARRMTADAMKARALAFARGMAGGPR